MADKTPDKKEDKSMDKNRKDNDSTIDSPEMKRDVNDLRKKEDLLNWLDDSPEKNKQTDQGVNRRRTNIAPQRNSDFEREFKDIVGKGNWVEAETPEQLRKLQPGTPGSIKYLIDLVSSLSSNLDSTATISPNVSAASGSSSPDGSGRSRHSSVSEVIQQRLTEARRLFVAELEEHQLKFALIILAFAVFLIHMLISLFGSD